MGSHIRGLGKIAAEKRLKKEIFKKGRSIQMQRIDRSRKMAGSSSINIGQKKKSHTRFFVLMALLLLSCFVEYVFQINVPQWIMLAFAFLIAAIGDQDEIIAMCMCCIPLHTFFEYAFAILFGMLCYIIKYGRKIRLNYGIIPVALMLLWELLHCFGKNVNVMQFGGHCVTWLLLAVLISSPRQHFDYDFIVRAFVIAILTMCSALISKVLFASEFNTALFFSNIRRLGMDEENGTVINPNTLGILCVLGIAALTQLRIAGRKKKIDMVFIVLMLLLGIMTASRTYLACLVFGVMLLLFSIKRKMIVKLRYAVGVLLIGLTVLLLSYLFMPDMLSYYISRFFVSDISTGRMSTMGIYHKFIVSNLNVLFYGIGLQQFSVRVMQLCPQASFVPHNGIQELIIAWGLPGLVFFAALWAAMFFYAKKKCGKRRLIHFVPFLIILLKIQAGQMLNSPYTMLTFSFTYLSMCANLSQMDETASVARLYPQPTGIDLTKAIKLLLQKICKIAIAAVAFAAISCIISKFMLTPIYESNVLFYVNNRIAIEGVTDSTSTDDIYVSKNLISSCQIILHSRSFLNRVIEYTNSDILYSGLGQMISADSVNETEIIEVIVSDADPEEAKKLADAIAVLLPEHIEGIIDGASITVVEYANVPGKSGYPSVAINTAVGFCFGFVLCVVAILLKAMSDRIIHTQQDVVQIQDLSILAVIPDLKRKEKHRRH